MEVTTEFIRNHFFTKKLPHLDSDRQTSYDELRSSLFNDIEPANALEHQLFEQLVHASWQLDRARALEDHSLFQLMTDPENQKLAKQYRAYVQNRRSLDTTINRAMRELRRLIASRVLAVALNGTTEFTTKTNANVPVLLDLQQTMPLSELRPQRAVLSLSLARLKNPSAIYTDQEALISQIQASNQAA